MYTNPLSVILGVLLLHEGLGHDLQNILIAKNLCMQGVDAVKQIV